MSIQELTSITPQGSCEPAKCEACGNAFSCGASLAGCWCTEVTLSEHLRTRLRERYQQCLCRKCLEAFAEADREATGREQTLRVD
ncbi:MAG TPA: cysteine-rich CWC family protein [Pyrinomonadaceae bacterium]